ncbi:MAG: hypothetical protein LBB22_04345 [Treponema sp.]|nr:hypothetical protein [Treponema sp.]
MRQKNDVDFFNSEQKLAVGGGGGIRLKCGQILQIHGAIFRKNTAKAPIALPLQRFTVHPLKQMRNTAMFI